MFKWPDEVEWLLVANGLWETAYLLGFPLYALWRMEKYSLSESSLGENVLLMQEYNNQTASS